jgi:putative transcriptional regulator
MSNRNTIVAKRRSDGTLVQVLPDGSAKPLKDKTDWAWVRAMTDECDERSGCAAYNDRAAPHCAPGTATKTLRRALAVTQEEFAVRYHIPLGTLRDWE